MSKVQKKPQAVANLESSLVRCVRARGAVSRAELARELDLVPSTAGIYVDRLIDAGFLLETTKAARGLGRPPVFVELDPRGGRFIGIDFDARQVMAVVVDFAQRPLAQFNRTIPARANAARVLALIEDAIAEAIGNSERDVLGIGMGVPGPIDAERGMSLRYDFIRDWTDVRIGPRISERFHAPVYVENNLRSMALSEFWFGERRNASHLVCLGIRSGIGTGIIVDGQLLRGAENQAGEIGRWACPAELAAFLPPTKNAVGSKRFHTIEDVASLTALRNAAGGDAIPPELVEGAARVHGWIVHQLATLLNPESVVVTSPLTNEDVYWPALQAMVQELGDAELPARVVRSTLGEHSGALGAAALAFQHWKPRR